MGSGRHLRYVPLLVGGRYVNQTGGLQGLIGSSIVPNSEHSYTELPCSSSSVRFRQFLMNTAMMSMKKSVFGTHSSALALALLIFSAFTLTFPPFASNGVLESDYRADDFMGSLDLENSSFASVAWRYFAFGNGIHPTTKLPRGWIGGNSFTFWDFGMSIDGTIGGYMNDLIGETEYRARIDALLTFLETMQLDSTGKPHYAYY